MSKILITGGAGFIGSAVIRHIINNTDHSVINVDKLTYAGNLESLTSIEDNERYAFEQVDICNAAEIKRVFNEHQPDIVMHLAAESHVDRSIDGPGEFIQTNIVGTYVLLEEARDYWSNLDSNKKDNFRFHHVSTDNDEATDQVYDVALNDRTSLNKLYQMIEERLIQRTKGLEKKEPIYQDFRAGDVRHSQANIDKAQALLNYQPKYMIEKGMDKAMDWYVNSLAQNK